MIHLTAHPGKVSVSPNDRIQQLLIQKGYTQEYSVAMQQFIRDRILNGQYTQVFSSHQPEPEPEQAQELIQEVTQVQLPWYKRLFVRNVNGS